MATKTISELIDEAAAKAKATSVDGMSSTAQSIPDLIAADKYATRKSASSAASLGLRVGVMRSTGGHF